MSSPIRSALQVTIVAAVMTVLTNDHAAAARECSAASGTQRVAVLELYTSEGCDSCPPDLYLAAFVQHPQSGDVLQALTAACR